MDDGYHAIDLGPHCRTPVATLVQEVAAAVVSYPEFRSPAPVLGEVLLRGFPFRIGGERQGVPVLLAPGRDGRVDPCLIPVERPATDVLFAHVVVASDLWSGADVGRPMATYTFRLADGTRHPVSVRERFEVGNLPLPWGQYPFLAVTDAHDVLEPRLAGPWERIGFRRTEVSKSPPSWWYLWSWTNPKPDVVLDAIEVEAHHAGLVVGGITVGALGEEPLRARTGVRMRLSLAVPQPVTDPPVIRLDRGVASWPYPLPERPLDSPGNGHPGYGAEAADASTDWYATVAAVPSATLSVEAASGTAAVPWHTIGGSPASGGHDGSVASVITMPDAKNRVTVTVVDADTGAAIPCRIAFQSPDGTPWPPDGHHAPIFSGLPDWNGDIGGDVRLSGATYAYIDGRCEGWLPRGDVIVDVARGFEVEALRRRLTIEPGQTELRLELRRWSDLASEGWYSGDTHVHFVSPQGALTEAAGEDLAVVNLLQTQWGHLFTNTEDFTGRPQVSADGRHVVWVSQENRQHILGHINLLGLTRPVMPWTTGGPGEAAIGSGLESTLARWADAGRAAGATVILAHFPTPNAEAAALVATGRADAAEMFDQLDYEHREYYRYLGAGYRLPLVAGTDKMSSGIPVGLYRTWARLEDGEPFSFPAWTAAVRAGRTFISSGPILRFTVDGRPIGSTIEAPNGATLEVEGRADSIFPVHALQLVVNGRVVDEAASSGGARSLRLRSRITVDGAAWVALRCGGPGYRPLRHFDERRRGVMAHTSPIYLSAGGRYDLRDAATDRHMELLVRGALEYIRHAAPRIPEADVTHAHRGPDHLAWLEEPFHEALAALRARRDGAR